MGRYLDSPYRILGLHRLVGLPLSNVVEPLVREPSNLVDLVDLLAPGPLLRQAAIERLSLKESAARYAVRRALWHDTDARVRARAASRLGHVAATAAAEVAGWLVDAAGDGSPLVREASLRVLGRLGSRRAAGHLARELGLPELCGRLALTDPVWWVRRAAARAVALLDGEAAIGQLRRVLGDPFWRVRQAAVRALLRLGDAQPSLRTQILASNGPLPGLVQSGLWYLRLRWEPELSLHAFPTPPSPNRELDNADPAVVTARLRARSAATIDPLELVPLLGDAHRPLRLLAVARLQKRPELPALRAALVWLETPTQPHGAETVSALLASLGEPAQKLCQELLRDPSAEVGLGALRWACRYAASTMDSELQPLLLAWLQAPSSAVRAAVIEALGALVPLALTPIAAALTDPDCDVRSAAALALATAGSNAFAAPHAALAAQRAPLSDYRPWVRGAMVESARRHRDLALLESAAQDAHPLVRSQALGALAQLGLLTEVPSRFTATDPAVRSALLGHVGPTLWLQTLMSDPDPYLRRQALRLLVGHRRKLPRPLRHAAAESACTATDSDLRTLGCELLDPQIESELRLLLRLSRERDLGVRAAAAAAVERSSLSEGLAEKLLALLDPPQPVGTLPPEERAAAYVLLFSILGAEAQPLVEKALAGEAEPPLVRHTLLALCQLFPNCAVALPDSEVDTAGAPLSPAHARPLFPAQGPRRLLGRTGIAVSPLGISGKSDLPHGALQAAVRSGVNHFFWEPGYLGLTRFLRRSFRRQPERRSELVVVAGSFEGDRVGIEHDLERALRRLGTDYIDVFLLFWARSPERLAAPVRSCLSELKRQGRIRAYGFSTHHRELAMETLAADPWDVVMLRHSAAHPGAEERLLPLCAEREVGVLSFSALCYGRLLRPAPGEPFPSPTGDALPSAGDCYRYSLEQPAIAACLSAPRRSRELQENLLVLPELGQPLSVQALARLRHHGQRVRSEDQRWNVLLRKGHEGAVAVGNPACPGPGGLRNYKPPEVPGIVVES